MITSALHIKDVLVKKGEITVNKDKSNNGNRNSYKEKNKPWNKNNHVVNNGVVYTSKPKEPNFNLTSSIQTKKQQEASKSSDLTNPMILEANLHGYQNLRIT